jgi:hypothetical protein
LRTIDTDIHPALPSVDDLLPYLPRYWQEELRNTSFHGAADQVVPRASPICGDSRTVRAVEDAAALVAHRFAPPQECEAAVLTSLYAVDAIRNPDAAAAIASAINNWQVARWLDHDSRFRASIVVPSQYPDLAAAEIRRARGADARFVQVTLPVRAASLYGQRAYHPLFEAAAECRIVVGLHQGGFSGHPSTSVGWSTYQIEEYVNMSAAAQAQLLSLLAEGIFVRYDGVRLAIHDCGFCWLPGFLWRLDKDWKGLRREVPWVKEAPSEYVYRHVKFGTGHVDVPCDQPAVLRRALDDLRAEHLLMYASDLPHSRSGRHDGALSEALSDGAAARVMADNAEAFYGLD